MHPFDWLENGSCVGFMSLAFLASLAVQYHFLDGMRLRCSQPGTLRRAFPTAIQRFCHSFGDYRRLPVNRIGTILPHHGSNSTAENARGARVPPGWSGCSCARFLPEGPDPKFFHNSPFQGGQSSSSPRSGYVEVYGLSAPERRPGAQRTYHRISGRTQLPLAPSLIFAIASSMVNVFGF